MQIPMAQPAVKTKPPATALLDAPTGDLHFAVDNGLLDVAEGHLDAGHPVNGLFEHSGTRCTALHLAYEEDMAQLLVSRGADLNARDGRGHTPLMVMAQHNRAEPAAVLLKAGADITLTNDDGKTATDIARARRSSDVLDLLKQVSDAPKTSPERLREVAGMVLRHVQAVEIAEKLLAMEFSQEKVTRQEMIDLRDAVGQKHVLPNATLDLADNIACMSIESKRDPVELAKKAAAAAQGGGADDAEANALPKEVQELLEKMGAAPSPEAIREHIQEEANRVLANRLDMLFPPEKKSPKP
jgi:hypothetical protein